MHLYSHNLLCHTHRYTQSPGIGGLVHHTHRHTHWAMCASTVLNGAWSLSELFWTPRSPSSLSSQLPHCAALLWDGRGGVGGLPWRHIYSLLFSHPRPSLSVPSGSGAQYPSMQWHAPGELRPLRQLWAKLWQRRFKANPSVDRVGSIFMCNK